MKEPYETLKTLLVTEKATRCSSELNQYLFRVDGRANKHEIKRAVESLFKVKVLKVATMVRKGKLKKLRTITPGMTSSYKRAVVTLKKGDKIEFM